MTDQESRWQMIVRANYFDPMSGKTNLVLVDADALRKLIADAGATVVEKEQGPASTVGMEIAKNMIYAGDTSMDRSADFIVAHMDGMQLDNVVLCHMSEPYLSENIRKVRHAVAGAIDCERDHFRRELIEAVSEIPMDDCGIPKLAHDVRNACLHVLRRFR